MHVGVNGKSRIIKGLAHEDRGGLVTHTRKGLQLLKGGGDLREGGRKEGKQQGYLKI